MKSIVVFCASSIGENPIYKETAYLVGKTLAEKNIRIIYGGGGIGCMGELATGAIDAGGEIIGVLPHFLTHKEQAKIKLTELIMVDSMHERKLKMNQLSDAVITLPGGFGTMEEFFEIITWGQLGLHQKPIGLLNVNNYYDYLISFIHQMNKEKLLKDHYLDLLLTSDNLEDLFQKMENYTPPPLEKWLNKSKT